MSGDPRRYVGFNERYKGKPSKPGNKQDAYGDPPPPTEPVGEPRVYLQDADLTLYHGDVTETLAQLPDESVDCVITSPPYWGLRDYGTGAWLGGDPDCDHVTPTAEHAENRERAKRYKQEGRSTGQHGGWEGRAYRSDGAGDVCGKCGAQRQDRQLGLEPTPDQYVERMVQVFREVRRVLAPHGTCWVNLGDSYNTGTSSPRRVPEGEWKDTLGEWRDNVSDRINVPTLKPKDLVGIPWRIAFALQADGWYLRADIIWSKPNPMPESVTDRPTKAHEYVFLLTKRPRYWFDQEAVRETLQTDPDAYLKKLGGSTHADGTYQQVGKGRKTGGFNEYVTTSTGYVPNGRNVRSVWEIAEQDDDLAPKAATTPRNDGKRWNENAGRGFVPTSEGRNQRSVWTIATQPYPDAHFATYPEELVRRCLLAGCPEWVCRVCGKPRERILENSYEKSPVHGAGSVVGRHYETGANNFDGAGMPRLNKVTETLGWSDCGCSLSEADDGPGDESRAQQGTTVLAGVTASESKWRPGIVLDPFAGSGTTATVARKHGRHSILIELNQAYCELIAQRTRQLSLLAEPVETVRLEPKRGLTGGAYSPPGQTPHSNARGKR